MLAVADDNMQQLHTCLHSLLTTNIQCMCDFSCIRNGCLCRLHINVYVSALVMIREKVIKTIPTEITSWFANWNDDRKFHQIAGTPAARLHQRCARCWAVQSNGRLAECCSNSHNRCAVYQDSQLSRCSLFGKSSSEAARHPTTTSTTTEHTRCA